MCALGYCIDLKLLIPILASVITVVGTALAARATIKASERNITRQIEAAAKNTQRVLLADKAQVYLDAVTEILRTVESAGAGSAMDTKRFDSEVTPQVPKLLASHSTIALVAPRPIRKSVLDLQAAVLKLLRAYDNRFVPANASVLLEEVRDKHRVLQAAVRTEFGVGD